MVNFPDFTTLKEITLAHLFQFIQKVYSANKKKIKLKVDFQWTSFF